MLFIQQAIITEISKLKMCFQEKIKSINYVILAPQRKKYLTLHKYIKETMILSNKKYKR